MKLATNCVPHVGGTYSVFCRLREGLAPHRIRLRWLGVGPAAAATVRHSEWKHELSNGEVVASDIQNDDRTAARLLVEHLEREQYDGVLVNVLSGRLVTNLARYLPAQFLRVLVVHTTSLASYKAARAVRNYAPATICVSARIWRDLVAGYGFDERRTFIVPNAADLERFENEQSRHDRGRTLKLIFLGRLEDESKGVFWLPKVFEALDDVDVSLMVVGDGPDRTRLQEYCARFGNRVNFAGFVQPDEVSRVLAQHDVLVMPSRYEGFGLSLTEAMAAGCVPVASRISGSTDAAVSPGEDGFLFPIGDTKAAANLIRRLAQDRKTLKRMSDAARRKVRARFSIQAMASQYASILWQARATTVNMAAPLPLDRWHYPMSLRLGLRSYLPTPVKKTLRLWRERLAA